MLRWGKAFGLLSATLLALAGCKTQPFIRPPKPPEQLIAPPIEEARFSQPPEYPKYTLNEDKIKKPAGVNKDKEQGLGSPGGMPRPGSMGSSGGY